MPTQQEIINELARYPVATVYEALGKVGDMSNRIRPVGPGMRLAGPALTVKTFPGDMQPVFHAITRAQPGDILVVDAGDAERGTIWGGTGAAAALAKGIKGLVTNGATRDLDEVLELKFPVFAAGVSLRGTVRGQHMGWIGTTIAIGDVPVSPGDIILADSDGVLVIPQLRGAEAVHLAEAQHERESKRDERLRNGENVVAVLNLPAWPG